MYIDNFNDNEKFSFSSTRNGFDNYEDVIHKQFLLVMVTLRTIL